MIRKFKCPYYTYTAIVSIKETPNGFMYTWSNGHTWNKGESGRTYKEQIEWYLSEKWTEVASTYDPNDLFPCCKGQSGQGPFFYYGGKWHEATCTELSQVAYAMPGGGNTSAPTFSSSAPGAISHPSSQFNLPDFVEQPKNFGQCTCGSTSVGSDRHSHWCDIK